MLPSPSIPFGALCYIHTVYVFISLMEEACLLTQKNYLPIIFEHWSVTRDPSVLEHAIIKVGNCLVSKHELDFFLDMNLFTNNSLFMLPATVLTSAWRNFTCSVPVQTTIERYQLNSRKKQLQTVGTLFLLVRCHCKSAKP